MSLYFKTILSLCFWKDSGELNTFSDSLCLHISFHILDPHIVSLSSTLRDIKPTPISPHTQFSLMGTSQWHSGFTIKMLWNVVEDFYTLMTFFFTFTWFLLQMSAWKMKKKPKQIKTKPLLRFWFLMICYIMDNNMICKCFNMFRLYALKNVLRIAKYRLYCSRALYHLHVWKALNVYVTFKYTILCPFLMHNTSDKNNSGSGFGEYLISIRNVAIWSSTKKNKWLTFVLYMPYTQSL